MELNKKIYQILEKANKKFTYLQAEITSSLLKEPVVFSPRGIHQHFHSASVGKLATALVILRLIEKGLLGWDTPIHILLNKDVLNNLFVFHGTDYSNKVTVEHLLGHTSGINDYFEGITSSKVSFIDQVLQHPERIYKPEELVAYTAQLQQPIGIPGEKYLYSDTGYILLAFIAEKVTSKPFYHLLREEVFNPLHMDETGLLFYDPLVKLDMLAPVMVKGIDIRTFPSLSIDYSGGGLATTLGDLTKLMVGLYQNQLISSQTYQRISNFPNHFESGMFYGLGLMEIRFEKMFFLLKGLPRLHGHLGVLGVHAWMDPLTGDTYIINVGNMNQMVASFNLLISIVMEIHRERQKIKKERRK